MASRKTYKRRMQRKRAAERRSRHSRSDPRLRMTNELLKTFYLPYILANLENDRLLLDRLTK